MPWLDHEPNTTVAKLIREQWGQDPDYTPQAVTHFDAEKWVHTGWYSDNNPNPQISTTNQGRFTVQEGMSEGGTRKLKETNVSVLIWPPVDNTYVNGQNLKQYTYQLSIECERILNEFETGFEDLSWITIGDSSPIPDPDEAPLPYHWEVPVACGWEQD